MNCLGKKLVKTESELDSLSTSTHKSNQKDLYNVDNWNTQSSVLCHYLLYDYFYAIIYFSS